MKYFYKRPLFLLIIIFLFPIFKNWFISPEIIGGDWPYFFDEFVKNLSPFPPAWNPTQGNGLGGSIISYNLDQYLYFTAQIAKLFHLSWPIVYKIFWFGFFIVLSSFSITLLLKTVLKTKEYWTTIFGILFFTANTYILMVVGGGQMGVALAYSVAPFVLTQFIKLHSSPQNLKASILAGLILGLQIMFDPRIAYITMIAVIGYLLLHIKIKTTAFLFFSIGIAGLLNSYWLLPNLLTKSTGIPKGFFSEGSFQFFSFADFSHALSLLAPNWPENIFGKTYFLKPEFLLLPILAYTSLFSLKNFKNIAFFVLLGLLGVFLAKGTNPPFGEVNIWIYNHIPGMYLFRDATKFYLLIALSYVILIPYSLEQLTEKLKKFKYIFLFFAFVFFLFLIRPALFGELDGTFVKHEVPSDYFFVKNLLASQNNFFRTLWVPKQQRFTYVSNTHPAIEAQPLFSKENSYAPFHATNSAELVERFKEDDAEKYIKELSVKYVVIPYDSLAEIFLEDRKYSEAAREALENELDSISWLKKVYKGNLTIYETRTFNDHFSLSSSGDLSYIVKSPTDYRVLINTKSSNTLIFSENYNPSWIAKIDGSTSSTLSTKAGLMSFFLPEGSHTIEVYYDNEIYYVYGRIISGITFLFSLLFLFVLKSKDHEKWSI